jgi:hypothetical protein
MHKCQHKGCGKEFKTYSLLDRHSQTHSDFLYQCHVPGCKWPGSKLKTSVQKHRREKHPIGGEPAVWLCEFCGVSCQNTTNLWKHVLNKHGLSKADAKASAKGSKRFLRPPKGKLNYSYLFYQQQMQRRS